MAKNIGDGNSLPLQPSTQESAVKTVTAVASGDVKKALAASAQDKISRPKTSADPLPESEEPLSGNSATNNFYLNQQLIYNNKKDASLSNYINGSNNELSALTKKIQNYEKRGTTLTKDELTELKKEILAVKSNKYVYNNKEVSDFAKAVKLFNKKNLTSEKISGSLKTLKELKSGFKTRTTMDKVTTFKNAPATIGNVLKSGVDDVKHEFDYKGNGEKEALVFAGTLSIVSMGAGWKKKSRDLVAKNFDKDSATENEFNTGIKGVLSHNKRYQAKYIDNGYLLTGFKNLRNSADEIIIKTYEKLGKPINEKKLRIDFSSQKSINKYIKQLEKTATHLGLEKGLSGATTDYLEKLKSMPDTTEDQRIIIDAILEMRDVNKLKDGAIPEHMKELGIDTGLSKINYNKKSDIEHALNCYSNFFAKAGMTDYTKMSTRKLQKLLRDDSLDATTKTIIQDILTMKKQQQIRANKKFAAKTSAIKAYALVSKLLGSSDFMQGAQMAMQVVIGVKTALIAANIARKVLGKTAKFTGKKTVKVVAHFAKKTEKGAKVVGKVEEGLTKVNQMKAEIKGVKTDARTIINKTKSETKELIKDKVKNSRVGQGVTKVKQSKVVNNKVTKGTKKVTSKIAEKATDLFGKLLSAFNFLNKLKLYILIGIGSVALGFYLIYAMLLPFTTNSTISAPVEMVVQTDASGNAIKDANGNYTFTFNEDGNIENTVFYKIYDLLATTDNNWFVELESIKEKNPNDVVWDTKRGDVNAQAYFSSGTVTGFWNPKEDKLYEIDSFGTDDKDENNKKINDGVYYSFQDNNGKDISRHSNIKMCISLAHGFINGDYENFPDEFKEFAMGLWQNSHNSTTVLLEQNLVPTNKYIYPCIGGDEKFDYKCVDNDDIKKYTTSAQDALASASANNATIKVITSDTKNSDYANAVKQTLIVTENGCTSKTHKNNGNTGYVLYDNILHKETKNTTSDGLAINYSKSYTSSTPEFTVYNKDSLLTDPTSTITLSSTQTLYYSSACDNYSIVEDGTYITKFCNQSYIGNTAIGQHPSIKGCIATTEPTFCGTKKTTLNGNQAYVNNITCTNSSHHSFKHEKITVTETVTETKIVSIFPFITQQVTKEVQKQVLDPACDASFFGECLTHYWYECHGHVDAYCNGHQIPNYKIQCNGHNDCSGHTANICSGHVDLDVASTIVGLDENDNLYTKNMWEDDEIDDGVFNLFSPNYRSFEDLCNKVYGPKNTTNNPLINVRDEKGNLLYSYYIWDPDKNGGTLHWADDMKGYTEALYNTDWFELYNFKSIYAKHKIDTAIRLSDGEINDLIKKYYPCNEEEYHKTKEDGSASDYKIAYDKRALILKRALTGVERIPFHPSGPVDTLQVPFEANDFGSIIRDAEGKPVKVASSNGNIYFYLKGLDYESFVRWASTTATDKVNTSINKSTVVSINNASPGDIIHYNGTNIYGIYLGAETITVGEVSQTIYHSVEMKEYSVPESNGGTVDESDYKPGNVKLASFNPSVVTIYKTIS